MPHFLFEDEQIPYTEGQSVLDALLCNGKSVPYACKQGVCQSCILKAVSGDIPDKSNQDLKATQKEEGLFLSCITCAQDDLILTSAGTQSQYLGKIKELKKLNDSVMKMIVEVDKEFEYHPGQYVTVTNANEVNRCYSLASQPHDQTLELHISHHPHGEFSNWLFQEADNLLGQILKIQGPIGHCYYTQTEKDLICIAYGTGLAPLYGLIKNALACGHQGQITLYYGAASEENFYYLPELNALTASFSNFSYHLIEPYKTQNTFEKDALARIGDNTHARFFLCGPKNMVNTLRRNLYLDGISLSEIFADAFFSIGSDAA